VEKEKKTVIKNNITHTTATVVWSRIENFTKKQNDCQLYSQRVVTHEYIVSIWNTVDFPRKRFVFTRKFNKCVCDVMKTCLM